jgi:hypothetical protein
MHNITYYIIDDLTRRKGFYEVYNPGSDLRLYDDYDVP